MKETWCANPAARLTMHRVKKTIAKALDQVTLLTSKPCFGLGCVWHCRGAFFWLCADKF